MSKYALMMVVWACLALALLIPNYAQAGDGHRIGISITMPLNMKNVGERGTFTVYGERFTKQDIIIEAPVVTNNYDNSNTSIDNSSTSSTTIRNTSNTTVTNNTSNTAISNSSTSINIDNSGIGNDFNGGVHIH